MSGEPVDLPPYCDDDDDYADSPDETEDEMIDCLMGRDGQCGAAGSEHCDFECPIMRERRIMRPRRKRR